MTRSFPDRSGTHIRRLLPQYLLHPVMKRNGSLRARVVHPGGSDFEWAGPLTETVLLGNIVLRSELKEKLSGIVLEWDPDKFGFTNLPEADKFLHTEYRKGWSL